MKYIKKFEQYVKEDVATNTDILPDAKVAELSKGFKASKEITFKFNKPIGGLNSITFIKEEGKLIPRVKEDKIALIKAAKAVWGDVKKYLNDVVKYIANIAKLGYENLITSIQKLFGLKTEEIEQELATANEGTLSNILQIISIICVIIGTILIVIALVKCGFEIYTFNVLFKVAIGQIGDFAILGQIGSILFGTGVVTGIASSATAGIGNKTPAKVPTK